MEWTTAASAAAATQTRRANENENRAPAPMRETLLAFAYSHRHFRNRAVTACVSREKSSTALASAEGLPSATSAASARATTWIWGELSSPARTSPLLCPVVMSPPQRRPLWAVVRKCVADSARLLPRSPQLRRRVLLGGSGDAPWLPGPRRLMGQGGSRSESADGVGRQRLDGTAVSPSGAGSSATCHLPSSQ